MKITKIDENDIRKLRKILDNEKYPIILKRDKSILQLLGFVKCLNELNEVIFGFKIKHDRQEILLYKKEFPTKDELEKINLFLDYIQTEKKYEGYKIKEIK